MRAEAIRTRWPDVLHDDPRPVHIGGPCASPVPVPGPSANPLAPRRAHDSFVHADLAAMLRPRSFQGSARHATVRAKPPNKRAASPLVAGAPPGGSGTRQRTSPSVRLVALPLVGWLVRRVPPGLACMPAAYPTMRMV
jgi:hypothetical protein